MQWWLRNSGGQREQRYGSVCSGQPTISQHRKWLGSSFEISQWLSAIKNLKAQVIFHPLKGRYMEKRTRALYEETYCIRVITNPMALAFILGQFKNGVMGNVEPGGRTMF
jgi:hypothetical protein